LRKKDFTLFLIAGAFMGISQSIDSSTFNNFFNDVFHVTVTQRTLMELPREFPGIMVVFVLGMLLFLGDIRIAFVANILSALGMLAIGCLSKNFGITMLWVIVYSMGQHLLMPVQNSIGMKLAEEGEVGKILGKINGLNTAAFLVTSIITAIVLRYVKLDYRVTFSIGAIAYMASAVLIFKMTPYKSESKIKKLFVKKEYSLFYYLSILNGARKQIFITFGPWVLIKIFNQGVSTFALLGFLTAGVGIFFKPYVGYLIDSMGERFVLTAEALLLILVCTGYAFAKSIPGTGLLTNTALYITCACFVVDQLLTAATMARATYLKKIAVNSEDISPTLSMGISMDHVVSMFIPWLGSLIWNAFGYEYVFIAGACIAIMNFTLAMKIKIPMQKSVSV
jgi:MFS family permease